MNLTEIISEGQQVKVLTPYKDRNTVTDLKEVISNNFTKISDLLSDFGAILIRGYNIQDYTSFNEIIKSISPENLSYVDGNSPRTRVYDEIYTSTEYPKEYKITLHNELSYSKEWPSLIFFFCDTPSDIGGETPILDGRYFLEKLDKGLVEKFERLGVKYTRLLGGKNGVGKTWMDTFETNDRKEVEAILSENGSQFEWLNNDLKITQFGPGVIEHPKTNEKVWFNQANQFHPLGLPDDISEAMTFLYGDDSSKYPQYAFFGNGEDIPEEYIKEITDKSYDKAIMFKWEKGDILILDNILMAHGRNKFEGDRKILVGMG